MASRLRKDKSFREASRSSEPAPRGLGLPAKEQAVTRLSPEWLASMLLDVTAHLMNAIERAARLREPIERIAVATQASAEAHEAAALQRQSRRKVAIAATVLVAVLAVIVPIAVHTSFFGLAAGSFGDATLANGAYRFTLGGLRYETTREAFERRLTGVAPETIHKYWVEIGGRRFPVKQAVSVGLSAERASFSSGQAIGILRKLGFHPHDTSS